MQMWMIIMHMMGAMDQSTAKSRFYLVSRLVISF